MHWRCLLPGFQSPVFNESLLLLDNCNSVVAKDKTACFSRPYLHVSNGRAVGRPTVVVRLSVCLLVVVVCNGCIVAKH